MRLFDSGLDNSPDCILCFYVNTTSRIQIIQLTNIDNFDWQRVVFPGQRLMFEAVPSAILEIQNAELVSILIPCDRLRINDKSTSTKSPSLTTAS